MKIKKTEFLLNKPAYLGLSTLELSKVLMYEFWYDYIKPKYDYIKPKYSENAKRCYMDTDSFIVHVKTDDICKDMKK